MKMFDMLLDVCKLNVERSEWLRNQSFGDRLKHITDELRELSAEINKEIDTNDGDIENELGDVIGNIFLLATVLEENFGISINQAMLTYIAKIRSRKPHIFTGEPKSADEELEYWNKVKRERVQHMNDALARLYCEVDDE